MNQKIKQARLKRLSEGRCVIHGRELGIDHGNCLINLSEACSHCGERKEILTYVPFRCIRESCEIIYLEEKGTFYLAPEFQHLIE